jgi:protein with PEP-CTERM/exosortase system signal
MKVNIIPTKKLALLSAAFCTVLLTFSQNASGTQFTLGFFPDPHVVGTVTPDDPDDVFNESGYINFMRSLGLGLSGTLKANTIARSTNVFAHLPAATEIFSGQGEGTVVETGGPPNVYSYVLAKYDGQNDLSQVWWVGDPAFFEADSFVIPMFGPNGTMLSHWSLFASGLSAPDGGATIMLLGGALGALGMARRYLMSGS